MTDSSYRGRVEMITPEMAVKWLEKVVANRVVVQSRVDSLAADILAGRWMLTGDPIRFDTTGEMIDGQHRLWAIVQADQAVESYVVRGLPPGAKLVIDTGTKRTLGNFFQITEEKNAPLLAGIITLVYRYDHGLVEGHSRGPTHAEAAQMLKQAPQLRDSVAVAMAARSAIRLAPSPMGAAHALNSRADTDAADEFWQTVIEGTGLPTGSPIIAYQRYAMRQLQVQAARGRHRSETQLAHVLKAMNLWRAGKTVRTLSWYQSESFPPAWPDGNGSKKRSVRRRAR